VLSLTNKHAPACPHALNKPRPYKIANKMASQALVVNPKAPPPSLGVYMIGSNKDKHMSKTNTRLLDRASRKDNGKNNR
jgi:hypothetical protein